MTWKDRKGGLAVQAMLFPMALTGKMALIVVCGVFLASFVDGIAGGGGIISVPVYFLAGLPAHLALGTNKLSSGVGTAVSAGRFVRGGYVNWRLAVPSVLLALFGAHLGTRLQLSLDERVLKWLLLAVLPAAALAVLRRRPPAEERSPVPPGRQAAVVLGASLLLGAYDGFYGPGAGTLMLLLFSGPGGLDTRTAAGNVKLVNLASNAGALFTSLLHGKVFVVLGLIGACASVAGHYLGSGMAIRGGERIVRPVILLVLLLLAVKLLSELIA